MQLSVGLSLLASAPSLCGLSAASPVWPVALPGRYACQECRHTRLVTGVVLLFHAPYPAECVTRIAGKTHGSVCARKSENTCFGRLDYRRPVISGMMGRKVG